MEIGHVTEKTHTTILLEGPATYGIEAVMGTVCGHVPYLDHRVLVLENGTYGEKVTKILDKFGLRSELLKFPRDNILDVEKILAEIKEEIDMDDYMYVYFVHHETGTGILNPLKELA